MSKHTASVLEICKYWIGIVLLLSTELNIFVRNKYVRCLKRIIIDFSKYLDVIICFNYCNKS